MNIWSTFYKVHAPGFAIGFDGLFTARARVWEGNLKKNTAVSMNLFYGDFDPNTQDPWRPMENGQILMLPTSIVDGEIRL